MEKKMASCANCGSPIDASCPSSSLCGACVKNLPTAKYNSRIKN